MRRQAYQPILITDAARSQDDQLRSREVRYVIMMAIRALCVVVGAVLVGTGAPLLWLWLPLCGAGMIIIPWLAVLLANDRPPKEKHRLAGRLSGQHREPTPPRALSAGEQTCRIIDAEP